MPSYLHNALLSVASLLLITLWSNGHAVEADSHKPYPAFKAYYDASANGFGIGTVTISLLPEGENTYRYQQESSSSGIARLFGGETALESSLWQLDDDGHIRVLEYKSEREDGDDDDNVHLIFDWEHHRVKNVGAGDHWNIALPDGALDRLVMQLAILFELRAGKTYFNYQVPHQARIKEYTFALLGEDKVELTSGIYNTLKVGRTNDDKDQSWVWSAPELDYFPVRFLKEKKSGIKLQLELRKLDFAPFGEANSLEVVP